MVVVIDCGPPLWGALVKLGDPLKKLVLDVEVMFGDDIGKPMDPVPEGTVLGLADIDVEGGNIIDGVMVLVVFEPGVTVTTMVEVVVLVDTLIVVFKRLDVNEGLGPVDVSGPPLAGALLILNGGTVFGPEAVLVIRGAPEALVETVAILVVFIPALSSMDLICRQHRKIALDLPGDTLEGLGGVGYG